jgi:hypothetical protein
MATSFSGGRSQNTQRESPTMDKQLVSNNVKIKKRTNPIKTPKENDLKHAVFYMCCMASVSNITPRVAYG